MAPLKRTTALQRVVQPLKRTGWLPTALRPLRRLSGARRAYERELDSKRAAVLERSMGICEVNLPECIGTAPLDGERAYNIHHRLERSQKGGNALANLLHACAACHPAGIHEHPARAYSLGLLLHAGENPADVPVNVRRDTDG